MPVALQHVVCEKRWDPQRGFGREFAREGGTTAGMALARYGCATPGTRDHTLTHKGGTVAAKNENVRAPWVKPTLVQKPLEETQTGRGTTTDGLADFQS